MNVEALEMEYNDQLRNANSENVKCVVWFSHCAVSVPCFPNAGQWF